MYSVHHCHQTPSAPHWSAASTLHSSSRSDWSHPQYKPHAISDLITTVESCRVFNIPKRLAQMADVMTADIYWNSINAPLVTFCCRIIAPLNFCLSRCLEVMESCLFFICWSGADALLHFHQGRAAASSSCSLEKQIWFEVSFLCVWFSYLNCIMLEYCCAFGTATALISSLLLFDLCLWFSSIKNQLIVTYYKLINYFKYSPVWQRAFFWINQASTQIILVAHVRGGGNVATVCFTNTFPLVIHWGEAL